LTSYGWSVLVYSFDVEIFAAINLSFSMMDGDTDAGHRLN